ncbi:MAG: hypothetical protein MZV64_73160 [Ignavibacteriales bacterium]|nr:hypothetical protein [Ignavibacteriales bacterium]
MPAARSSSAPRRGRRCAEGASRVEAESRAGTEGSRSAPVTGGRSSACRS